MVTRRQSRTRVERLMGAEDHAARLAERLAAARDTLLAATGGQDPGLWVTAGEAWAGAGAAALGEDDSEGRPPLCDALALLRPSGCGALAASFGPHDLRWLRIEEAEVRSRYDDAAMRRDEAAALALVRAATVVSRVAGRRIAAAVVRRARAGWASTPGGVDDRLA